MVNFFNRSKFDKGDYESQSESHNESQSKPQAANKQSVNILKLDQDIRDIQKFLPKDRLASEDLHKISKRIGLSYNGNSDNKKYSKVVKESLENESLEQCEVNFVINIIPPQYLIDSLANYPLLDRFITTGIRQAIESKDKNILLATLNALIKFEMMSIPDVYVPNNLLSNLKDALKIKMTVTTQELKNANEKSSKTLEFNSEQNSVEVKLSFRTNPKKVVYALVGIDTNDSLYALPLEHVSARYTEYTKPSQLRASADRNLPKLYYFLAPHINYSLLKLIPTHLPASTFPIVTTEYRLKSNLDLKKEIGKKYKSKQFTDVELVTENNTTPKLNR